MADKELLKEIHKSASDLAKLAGLEEKDAPSVFSKPNRVLTVEERAHSATKLAGEKLYQKAMEDFIVTTPPEEMEKLQEDRNKLTAATEKLRQEAIKQANDNPDHATNAKTYIGNIQKLYPDNKPHDDKLDINEAAKLRIEKLRERDPALFESLTTGIDPEIAKDPLKVLEFASKSAEKLAQENSR